MINCYHKHTFFYVIMLLVQTANGRLPFFLFAPALQGVTERRAAEMTDVEIIPVVVAIITLVIASMTLLLKLLAFLIEIFDSRYRRK